MKRLLKNTFFLALLSLMFSCNSEKFAYEDLFAGTSPFLEIENGNIEPFVIFLNIHEGSIDFNENTVPFNVIDETDEEIILETNLTLNNGLIVKHIKFQTRSEILRMEIDGINRTLELEKYDKMIQRKVDEFVSVKLSSDISHLSDNQKELLRKLFHAAAIMDDLFWKEACPDKEQMLAGLTSQAQVEFFMLNYGPWERLNGDLSFLPSIGAKPEGAGFYPPDMTKNEFDNFNAEGKDGLYTLIKRKNDGTLDVLPYHKAFAEEVKKVSSLLLEAADLAEDEGFEKYLRLRAEAMLTDDYYESDLAWMEMKNNEIDFVIGPIENYEDKLYNYKAAHEAFILIKDKEWSEKLSFISSFLPELQKALPVPAKYKQEKPGSDSDLGAYDAVFYAGDCNASSKTIAINLPNDERVQAAKGSRKLQLKNSIRYKFEEILVPISNVLIAEDQRSHITFNAFFENTMFHEVAHGLGLNTTINGKGTVRGALMEQYSALEEGKADILGLFLVTKLSEMGKLGEKDLMDNYVTFMASIFRSVRFGVASSHGKSNMIRFYYFQETGAFTRDNATGTYRIDFEKMQDAMNTLAQEILTIQGDGNYEAAKQLVDEKGFIREELQNDLERLKALNIPVDIKFEQGPDVLGL